MCDVLQSEAVPRNNETLKPLGVLGWVKRVKAGAIDGIGESAKVASGLER